MGRGRRRAAYRPGPAVRAVPGMVAFAVAAGAAVGLSLHLLSDLLAGSVTVAGVRPPAGYLAAGIPLAVLLAVLALPAALLRRSPAWPPPPSADREPHDEAAALQQVIARLEADRAFWFAVGPPPRITPVDGATAPGRSRRTRSGHRVVARPAPRCCWGRRAPLPCGGATR